MYIYMYRQVFSSNPPPTVHLPHEKAEFKTVASYYIEVIQKIEGLINSTWHRALLLHVCMYIYPSWEDACVDYALDKEKLAIFATKGGIQMKRRTQKVYLQAHATKIPKQMNFVHNQPTKSPLNHCSKYQDSFTSVIYLLPGTMYIYKPYKGKEKVKTE